MEKASIPGAELPPADKKPIIDRWQARSLYQLLTAFYSDPKNQAAYEAWAAEQKDQENKAGADRCVKTEP